MFVILFALIILAGFIGVASAGYYYNDDYYRQSYDSGRYQVEYWEYEEDRSGRNQGFEVTHYYTTPRYTYSSNSDYPVGYSGYNSGSYYGGRFSTRADTYWATPRYDAGYNDLTYGRSGVFESALNTYNSRGRYYGQHYSYGPRYSYSSYYYPSIYYYNYGYRF